MSAPPRAAVWLCLALCWSCRTRRQDLPQIAPSKSASGSPIVPPDARPEPRQGMVWVARGPLVAGTPESSLPRIADQEMPGEQVILKGFYIDVFPFPNEEGAIPLTNVSQAAASTACSERGKRLCSELEWERACKGPDNLRYEYGDTYRAERCGTGSLPAMRPTGIRVACRSGFGARDMHGGAWEWTSSGWGRGSIPGFASARGGNSPEGEIVGRCANARPQKPELGSVTVGFRCCAGETNAVEVVLDVKRGPALRAIDRIDKQLLTRILDALPTDATITLGPRLGIDVDHQWLWRPIGNEELYATRLCSGLGQRPACGVVVNRLLFGRPTLLAWAASRHWLPSVEVDRDARDLWMIGGDQAGTFQRLIQYRFGTVSVSVEERRLRENHPPRDKKSGKG